MFLFNGMPTDVSAGSESKERTSTCVTQSSTYKCRNMPCHSTYKWIHIYKTCCLQFWQPSDLTRVLCEGTIFSYHTIQEARSFVCKICGSKPAYNIDEIQSTIFVKAMSIENPSATRYADIHHFQIRRSHNQTPVRSQVNLQHPNIPQPETTGLVMEDNCLFPN